METIRAMTVDVIRISLLVVGLMVALLSGAMFPAHAGDGIRRFNFAPAEAPDFKPFIKIHGDTVYSRKEGYGWLDAEGPSESGKWPGSDFNGWQARRNLNLICRIGPDDLARSFFSGSATFALDLAPGKYEVWTLAGDSGFLESVPYEPFRIVVEGVTVYDFSLTADEFYRQFESPVLEDDLTEIGVWRRYIEPRFQWTRTVVDVQDGQLNVNVIGGQRDKRILDFIGDYAITETRGGPPDRFAGALNALVVLPAGGGLSGRRTIEEIDALRRKNFAAKWPLKHPERQQPLELTAADRQRGYTVFLPSPVEPAGPQDRRPHAEKPLRLKATPGEYVPITFGICPLQDLGATKVALGSLRKQSDGGTIFSSTKDHLVYGVVRYVAKPADREKKSWQPSPAMIVPTDTWDISNGVTKQFWLTLKMAEETGPGIYEGNIAISPEKAENTTVRIEIEVLPFKLLRPTYLSVGMTYFSPVQYAFFGEERFWKRVESEFKDMRAHNMTCVQYTGIRMSDHRRIDRAFTLYRAAGFENPVNLLESYGAMHGLQREGVAWETEEFHRKYVQFIREFLEESERRNWPPIIINFGDEFTNKAIEEFGARVAKNLKTIPGIVTGADTNGYKEVSLMAPVVDIVAFNNGWDGPKGVNHGKKLLKKETVDLVLKAGAIPWLVNVGVDRFSNGFWLWKMVRLGVRGKMEWMYRGYNGMPFNSFDANPMGAHIVCPGPDGTSVPSLEYEWMRMGLDDLAYLHTLERRIDEKRYHPAYRAAVASADAFLENLAGAIDDDMNTYLDRRDGAKNFWHPGRFEAVRGQVIDLIIKMK